MVRPVVRGIIVPMLDVLNYFLTVELDLSNLVVRVILLWLRWLLVTVKTQMLVNVRKDFALENRVFFFKREMRSGEALDHDLLQDSLFCVWSLG